MRLDPRPPVDLVKIANPTRYDTLKDVIDRLALNPLYFERTLYAYEALQSLQQELEEARSQVEHWRRKANSNPSRELRGVLRRAYDAPTWQECIRELEEGLGLTW
jgi:hypothetical protein